MVRTACGRCAGGHHQRGAAPSGARLLESRGMQVLVFDGPGGRADLRSVVDWLGRQRYLSLMIEAGSKLNWSALESGRGGPHLLLLRPQDSGRHGSAAAGRRHRTAPPVGRHPRTRYLDPPDSAGRIRGGRIPGCSPGLLKSSGTVVTAGCAPDGRLLHGAERRSRGREHRGERRLPDGRRPAHRLFAADLAPETLRRSNLGDLRAGSRVNLERPLSPAAGSAATSCRATWTAPASSWGSSAGRRQLVAADSRPGGTGSLPGVQGLDCDRRHQPDHRCASRAACSV